MIWMIWFTGLIVWSIPSLVFGLFNGASLLGAIMFIGSSTFLAMRGLVETND